jgi:nitrogen fixation protein NifT
MKITLRKAGDVLSVYVAKKDLEEHVVAIEKPGLWGGKITLGNGWVFQLPEMAPDTRLPISVEARKLES